MITWIGNDGEGVVSLDRGAAAGSVIDSDESPMVTGLTVPSSSAVVYLGY